MPQRERQGAGIVLTPQTPCNDCTDVVTNQCTVSKPNTQGKTKPSSVAFGLVTPLGDARDSIKKNPEPEVPGCMYMVGREGVEPSTLGLRVVRKIYTILRNLQYSFSTAENTEDLANTEQESIKKHANRSITYHVFGKSGKVRKHGCARRCWRNGPPLCELMRINSIKLASNTTFQHCSVEVSCGMA